MRLDAAAEASRDRERTLRSERADLSAERDPKPGDPPWLGPPLAHSRSSLARPTSGTSQGLTKTDQGRSIVSGPVITGGAFRSFAAARSRRSWLTTWLVMSV